MPFRPAFDCLWCGAAHSTRGPDDLEGWAQLCPSCIGRAGENGFLRMRLKAALAERTAPGRGAASQPARGGEAPARAPGPDGDRMLAYYAARAPEYDDWYLRRGRYDRGPLHTVAWQAELDAASLWLDRLPVGGEIVELAAGTGWWSPLLAGKGELWLYDAVGEPLDRARERLLAHGLRAHIHLRDAWADPDRPVDALFTGFWLSHVPRARLGDFLAIARRWLRPGGTYAFVDSRPDRESGATDQVVRPDAEVSLRRLSDGREFLIPKVFYEPAELEAALVAAGFADASIEVSGRFFLLGRATA